MAVLGANTTPEDWKLYDEWREDKVSGAEVLKDFTEVISDEEKNITNKMVVIKAGTKSHLYQHCYFRFLSEEGIEVLINVGQTCRNPEYFKKIEK